MIAEGRNGDANALIHSVGIPEEFVAGMRTQPFFPAMGHTVAYDGEIMEGLMSGKPLPAERWATVNAPTLLLYGEAKPAAVDDGRG